MVDESGVGELIKRDDGFWVLRIPDLRPLLDKFGAPYKCSSDCGWEEVKSALEGECPVRDSNPRPPGCKPGALAN